MACAWLPGEFEPWTLVTSLSKSLGSTLAYLFSTLMWRVCCAPPTPVVSDVVSAGVWLFAGRATRIERVRGYQESPGNVNGSVQGLLF